MTRPKVLSALLVLTATACTIEGGATPRGVDTTTRATSDVTAPTDDGVRLRQVDGGQDYYARWPGSLPPDPSFFPLAVWFESVTSAGDTALDRAAGLNTYVELTANSDLELVRVAGMHAIHGHLDEAGSETAGWLLADEADMWAGPGDASWTGSWPGQGEVCDPPGSPCGYDVQRTLVHGLPRDGRFRYANYGKGVTFWADDEQAARFVNEFQDVVSADNYWFTDENICGAQEGGRLVGGGDESLSPDECHLAANYGRTVDRLRSLVRPRGSKPVWAFVEVGHPAGEHDWPAISPEQIVAAVWSSLIHGARGIVYFNHSFGGPHPTQHALREGAYAAHRRAVTVTNDRITRLAPVLNAPFVDHLVATDEPVDVMVKTHADHHYVFAASRQAEGQRATLELRCRAGASVEVLDEHRSLTTTALTASRTGITDRFADGNAVHIYRIPSGVCVPPAVPGVRDPQSSRSPDDPDRQP